MLTGRMCERLRLARCRVEGFRELMVGVRRRSPAGLLMEKRYNEAMDQLHQTIEEAYRKEMNSDDLLWHDHICECCRFVGVVRDNRPCRDRR